MIIQKNFHSKIINHLAELCSKHKVVPFIGSGCSEDHLHVNWDSISKDLSKELNVDYTNNLEISQLYVNHFGYLKLCDYLKKKLIINDFTDEQGSSYLALMSLGLKSIYTTNFDNVFENCLKKYNRDFTKIVDLKDLNNSLPGDNFYYKFHGDLEKPTSIIFTESDYEKRIKDKNNFLNIRLKSDLLAKNLLFIGYSFRDKDIQFLINELNKTFDNELPNSYMIIWEYSDEINNLCNKYNIQLINPMDEFLNVQDNAEAFNKFLTELCNQTFIYKSNQELEDYFHPKVPNSTRIINKYEIDAIRYVVDTKSFNEGINIFRAGLDSVKIPLDFENEILNIFCKLCVNCSSYDQFINLNGAFFNLKFNNLFNDYYALAYMMVASNILTENYNDKIISKRIPIDSFIISLPLAIDVLMDLDSRFSFYFKSEIIIWVDNSVDFSIFGKEGENYIKSRIDLVWSQEYVTLEHPLKRKERLKNVNIKKMPSYHKILNEQFVLLPKIFKRIYE